MVREIMGYEMKTCPFCGGMPYLERNHRAFINAKTTRVAFVRCKDCNARSCRYELGDNPAEAKQMAVDHWNMRYKGV